MKLIGAIAFVALFVAAAYLWMRENKPQLAHNTVLITGGTGPKKVEISHHSAAIVNQLLPGAMSTQDIRSRVEEQLLNQSPGLVIVVIDGSDLDLDMTVEETLDHLNKLITRLGEAHVPVELVLPPPTAAPDNWNLAIEGNTPGAKLTKRLRSEQDLAAIIDEIMAKYF